MPTDQDRKECAVYTNGPEALLIRVSKIRTDSVP